MSVRVFGTCFMQEGIPALDVGNTFQWAGAPELNQKGGSEQKASTRLSCSRTVDAV